MSKHTPGPWRACNRIDSGRMVVSFLEGWKYTGAAQIAMVFSNADTDDTSNANAQLIAAAPDLLEALIKIAEFDIRAGCGCSHPCRCDTEYSRAIAFDTLRDIAHEALAKVGRS